MRDVIFRQRNELWKGNSKEMREGTKLTTRLGNHQEETGPGAQIKEIASKRTRTPYSETQGKEVAMGGSNYVYR